MDLEQGDDVIFSNDVGGLMRAAQSPKSQES
jgi:hypothetical protein